MASNNQWKLRKEYLGGINENNRDRIDDNC